MESLREEAAIEITNANARSKTLADLRSINLNRVDHVSPDVVLCADFGCLSGQYVACVTAVSSPFPGGEIEQASEQAGERRSTP